MRSAAFTLHRWLPAVSAVVAALALLLVVAAAQRIVADELVQRALQRVAQSAHLYTAAVEAEVSGCVRELQWLAHSVAQQGSRATPEVVRSEFEWLLRNAPRYVWIGWTSPEGQVRAATLGALEGRSIAERPVFRNGRQGVWFGSSHPPVLLRTELQRLQRPVPAEMADLGLPVRGPDGALTSVIAAHFDSAVFEVARQRILGPEPARRGMSLAVVEPSGAAVLGTLPPGLETAWQGLAPSVPAVVRAGGAKPYVVMARAVRPAGLLQPMGWTVVSYQPLHEALAPAAELQRHVWWWGGIAALFLGGLGAWLSRRWALPYARLLDAVAEHLPAGPKASLSTALDTLLRRLPSEPPASASPGEHLIAQALHDAERIRTMLDGLPAPVYLTDLQQRLVYWNRQAAEAFGWTVERDAGRPVREALEWIDDGTAATGEPPRADGIASARHAWGARSPCAAARRHRPVG